MEPTEPIEPTQKTPEPTPVNPDTEETVIHVMTTNPEQQYHVSVAPASPSSRRKGPALAIVLCMLLIGIGAYSFSSGNKPSSSTAGTASVSALAPAQVSVTSSGFVPATISIKVGQAVTWTDTDSGPHVVAGGAYPTDNGPAGFNSEQNLTTSNDHYSFAFDKAGTYTYHDDLNPYVATGTVIVKQ